MPMRRSEHGFLRLGCIAVIAAIALTWAGGQGVYTGLTNLSPAEMTLKQYAQQKPGASWLKLTECSGFLPEAAYEERLKTVTLLYIPLYTPDGPDDEKPHVLLATERKEWLELFSEMKDLSEDQQLAFLLENRDKLELAGAFSGLVRFGIDLSSKERDQLASLTGNLAPDFVILDEGKEPSLGASVAMLLGGLVLGGYMLISMAGGSKDAPKSETEKGASDAPAAEGAPPAQET